jgi:hypothetical protein
MKDALGGVAITVGANVRQCLVLAYVTRAEGSDAPRLLAERLAFVTDRVFSHLEIRRIEDRVVPVERRHRLEPQRHHTFMLPLPLPGPAPQGLRR